MQRLKSTSLYTSAVISAALLASPLALAGEGKGHHGKRDHAAICEKIQDGDWDKKRDQYRDKYGERHEAMAERLQLSDEQREIWNEMRRERQEKHEQRFEKMKERCENRDQE